MATHPHSPGKCQDGVVDCYWKCEYLACALSHFSHIQLFSTLWTVAHQTALSMGILQARRLEWVAMASSR